MAQIPLYQQSKLGLSGSDLPGPETIDTRNVGMPGRGLQAGGDALVHASNVLSGVVEKQNAAQEVLYRTKAAMDAEVGLDELFQQTKQSESDPVAFKTKVLAGSREILDNIAAGYSGRVATDIKAHLAGRFAEMQLKTNAEVFRKQVDNASAIRLLQEEQGMAKALNQTADGDFDAIPREIKNYSNMIDAQLATDMIGEEHAVALKIKYKENITMEGFREALQRDPVAIAGKLDSAIKAFGLTPEQARIARNEASHVVEAKRSEYLKMGSLNLDNIIADGKELSGAQDNALSVLKPDEQKEYLAEIEKAKSLSVSVQAFPSLGNSALMERLKELDPRGKNPNTRDIDNYKIVNEVARDIVALRKRDPRLSVEGLIDKNQSGERQTAQAIELQRKLEIPDPRALFDNQAYSMVEKYKSLAVNTDEKIAMISSLRDSYGEYSGLVINELNQRGLPPGARFLADDSIYQQVKLRIMLNDDISVDKLSASLGDKKENESRRIVADANRVFNETIGKTFNLKSQVNKQAVSEVVSKYALSLARDGHDSPVERTIKDMFGGYEVRGTMLIPIGYNVANITKYAKYFTDEGIDNIAEELFIGDYAKKTGNYETWKADLSVNGEWYTNEKNDGAILYHRSTPVLKKDGSYVEFKFGLIPTVETMQKAGSAGLDIGGYPVQETIIRE